MTGPKTGAGQEEARAEWKRRKPETSVERINLSAGFIWALYFAADTQRKSFVNSAKYKVTDLFRLSGGGRSGQPVCPLTGLLPIWDSQKIRRSVRNTFARVMPSMVGVKHGSAALEPPQRGNFFSDSLTGLEFRPNSML